MIDIENILAVCDDCIHFRFSRGSGPGGQNVNKVNSRATLLFDVDRCGGFSDIQKKKINQTLAKRIDSDGMITVTSRQYRTQKANRDAAKNRLAGLLENALRTPKVQKKTTIPYNVVVRRLEKKNIRSTLKKQRTWKKDDQ